MRPLPSSGKSTADRSGTLGLIRPVGRSLTVLPLAEPVRNMLSVSWKKLTLRWYKFENTVSKCFEQSTEFAR
eukprot:9036361-Pyramimonas_sp.AAC.1